ncbi:MAG: hypothetical protein KDC46_06505 [Thermoleophilia bacterium]|nr:hypothetical protein [Thermoleophilia bacterium]
MTETMLVRAAGGGWEELRPQNTMPEGGVAEVFGEDVGPVLGAAAPVIVAACSPTLATGSPDAICVDPDGGIWIVQLDMEGDGALALPQLLAFGGALTSASYDAFEALCDRCQGDPLTSFVEARAGAGFHKQSFEVAIADALAHGRFRLVAIVREAAPALVQSMRFLNSSGASGMLFEATSFASETVSAVRAKVVDIGAGALGAAGSAVPAADGVSAKAASRPALGAAGFVAATGKASGDDTGTLMAQLQKSCSSTFDEVTYDGEGSSAIMSCFLDAPDGAVAIVTSSTDGSVVVSFEALGTLDPGWGAREELCQGMERLLGADLGDVRKISQLNLSIREHLMDATLMEALCDLLADTVGEIRQSESARGAREAAAA